MFDGLAREKRFLYVVYGFFTWIFLDWGIAGGFHPSYVLKTNNEGQMALPMLLFFYVASPILFSFLVFNLNWDYKKLFAFTVAEMMAFEIIVFQNPLVFAFPLFLVGIPAGIVVYSLLNFLPLWVVNGELQARKKELLILGALAALLMLVSVIGHWAPAA